MCVSHLLLFSESQQCQWLLRLILQNSSKLFILHFFRDLKTHTRLWLTLLLQMMGLKIRKFTSGQRNILNIQKVWTVLIWVRCNPSTFFSNILYSTFWVNSKRHFCTLIRSLHQRGCYSFCFWSLFYSGLPTQVESDQKYSKISNIVKHYKGTFLFEYILVFYLFYPMMAKLNFQHHYSSLQCHTIYQKSF